MRTEVFTFENPEQLKEKLDNSSETSKIVNIIPIRYKLTEMGASEKLVCVLIVYQ